MLFPRSADRSSANWETVSSGGEESGGETPRASRSLSVASSHRSTQRSFSADRSFLQDYIPRPGLARDLARAASSAASSVVHVVAQRVAQQAQSETPSYRHSESVDPPRQTQDPSSSPSSQTSSSSSWREREHNRPPERNRSPAPAMATVLPLPAAIKLKVVNKFDGSPADLSLFDTQIRNSLECLDIPAYYGGCVQGSASEGYDFVPSTTPGSVSNYRLGRKLCSAISKKFTGAAAQWWDDYDTKLENPKPNCWKPATAAVYVPEGVVEVSLFTLLTTQFDPTVDAQQAELELAKYRWNPLDKGALGVILFRGHVNRLCTRAGKSSWAIKGIAIRNTFPDWLRSRVMLSKSEDSFWDDVAACVNTYMADHLHSNNLERPDKRRNGSSGNSNGSGGNKGGGTKSCQFCSYNGHEFSECRKMKAAQQQLPPRRQRDTNAAVSTTATTATAANPAQQQNSQQPNSQQQARSNVTCSNCRRPGHISTNCPEPRRTPAQNARSTAPPNVTDTQDAPLYLSFPESSYHRPVLNSAPEVLHVTQREQVDDQEIIDVQSHRLDLPLYHVLSTAVDRQEVFSFSPPTTPLVSSPSSVLHSYTRSPGGQDMLTIWDTAALLILVPMSTVRALNLEFTPGSDISFVVANGSRMAPVGYCSNLQFSFPESTQMFGEKVYVVEYAPFQLLLGIRFLHRHWAAILLPWAQIVLLRPTRLEIQGSLERPSVRSDLVPDLRDDLRLVDVSDDPNEDEPPVADEFEILVTVPMHLEIGKRCLISELDGPAASDFQAPGPQTIHASATISKSFIKDTFRFGPHHEKKNCVRTPGHVPRRPVRPGRLQRT